MVTEPSKVLRSSFPAGFDFIVAVTANNLSAILLESELTFNETVIIGLLNYFQLSLCSIKLIINSQLRSTTEICQEN